MGTSRRALKVECNMHIHCNPADLGRYALIAGDPGRVPLISRFLDEAREITWEREFRIDVGGFRGVRVVAASHGIGAPSTAILVEELADLGVDTIIRVGTAGAIQPDRCRSGLVIASGAIRDERTSTCYLPMEFPAVPALSVLNALIQAAREQGVEYHVGIVQAKDSFYGEVEPERQPTSSLLAERWKAWQMGGALASEMECATLFIVGAVRRLRTGGILNIMGNPSQMESMILVGLNALKILAEQDASS
ncbi:MAG: nucleoside phosphorylase [Bacillota bacterium]